VSLEIATAGFAIVYAKAAFSLDGQNCEAVVVLVFAEWASGSSVPPAYFATTAR
jgi:hypothetical protein